MFMIPMPPTTSEMDAMPASRMVSRELMESTDCSSWAWSAMEKSSVPPVPMLCRWRRSAVADALTESICSGVATLMAIERTESVSSK